MTVTETATRKLTSMSGDLSDYLEDSDMTEKEKAALNEAERLADQYADIKPEHLVVSGNYLFGLPASIPSPMLSLRPCSGVI